MATYKTSFIFGLILLSCGLISAQQVLVLPYVQPGDEGIAEATDSKTLWWLTDNVPGRFRVEYSVNGAEPIIVKPQHARLDFGKASLAAIKEPAVNDPDDPPIKTEPLPVEKEQHYLRYSAILPRLPLNAVVSYTVWQEEQLVRRSSFKTRASADRTIRFAMVGDLANGKAPQNAIAYRLASEKPDFLVALGDLVYPKGRVNQYLEFYWNTYSNVEQASEKTGAPLMASIPFYAVMGNHDVDAKFPVVPDALGAYYFFDPPDHGPGLGPWCTALGSDKQIAANFRALNAQSYPYLDAYSFENGPAHFLVLNSNRSGNATEPKLLEWIEQDLLQSKSKWKFVCYHAPAFHSSLQHYTDQAFRFLHPLWERCGVDVVFAGHVHNYQRSVPFRFKPGVTKRDARGRVDGDFQLDMRFDGKQETSPKGVIHIVSGGGGATLYAASLEKSAAQLHKDHGANYTDYTAVHTADRHSFVMVELSPQRFEARALDAQGQIIDQFLITKPGK
jgi:hypothetical protein